MGMSLHDAYERGTEVKAAGAGVDRSQRGRSQRQLAAAFQVLSSPPEVAMAQAEPGRTSGG
jgi:hypothetical protein